MCFQAWIGAEDKLSAASGCRVTSTTRQVAPRVELSKWETSTAPCRPTRSARPKAAAASASTSRVPTQKPRRNTRTESRRTQGHSAEVAGCKDELREAHMKTSSSWSLAWSYRCWYRKTQGRGRVGARAAVFRMAAAARFITRTHGWRRDPHRGCRHVGHTAYGGTASHAYGSGETHATNAWGESATHYQGYGTAYSTLSRRRVLRRSLFGYHPAAAVNVTAPAATTAAAGVRQVLQRRAFVVGAALRPRNNAAATSNAYSAGVAAGVASAYAMGAVYATLLRAAIRERSTTRTTTSRERVVCSQTSAQTVCTIA
jgi:hypothetical protein